MAIFFGALEFGFLIIASREQVSQESSFTHKMLLVLFGAQAFAFGLGLLGIFFAVLSAS
jgi:hypothetical protein